MSLDVSLTALVESSVFNRNITHNLSKMAHAAGLYEAIWRPEEINVYKASDLVPIIEAGLRNLINNKDELVKLSPKNGWGSYECLLDFVQEYLENCRIYPESKINVWR